MKKLIHIGLLASALVITVSLSNVSSIYAAAPFRLHIEVDEEISDLYAESFVATGSAVDEGFIYPTGTVDDIDAQIIDTHESSIRIIKSLKRFSFDDLSGTFDVELIIRLNSVSGETSARWRIVAGTGSYADLKGSGSLVGTPIILGQSIHDVYDGLVF